MPRGLPQSQAGRVAVVSIVIVAVIAAAVGTTVWRYEAARVVRRAATAALWGARTTSLTTTAFSKERQAIDRYLFGPSPARLAAVNGFRAQFRGSATRPGAAAAPAESRLRDQTVAAEQRYYQVFARLRGAAGQGLRAENTVVGRRLEPVAPSVLRPLAVLERMQGAHTRRLGARAHATADQARLIGIIAAVLAVLAGAGFALFAVRLVSRGARREEDLVGTLERLGDRDELLARLRSASGVLGEVAAELRSAARNAASVTSEQSAAVAQTSSTIEELATAAGSMLATQQEKSAADQVEAAIGQIRAGADQFASEQEQWAATSERLETLVDQIEQALGGVTPGRSPGPASRGDHRGTASGGRHSVAAGGGCP